MGPLTPDGWFVWITGALWITSQLPYMGAFGVYSFSVDIKDRYWVAAMELCHHFSAFFLCCGSQSVATSTFSLSFSNSFFELIPAQTCLIFSAFTQCGLRVYPLDAFQLACGKTSIVFLSCFHPAGL